MEAANYDKGNLREYLKYESWQPESGLRVLVGLDYWHKSAFEDMPLGSLPDGARRTAEGTACLFDAHARLGQLGELARKWHGKTDRAKEHPPKYFIEWALEKGFRPEWLDWAKKQKLYEPADAPAAKVGAVPITHVNKLRRNTLDPAIDKAIEKAGNTELADVYLQLKEMALSGEKPFSGVIEGDALCYTDDNNKDAKLTKNALGKRLKTRSKSATSSGVLEPSTAA